ncbi:hypothetical protein [Pseudaquabacterium pictum]|nr:hypothetical protein [Rubrivivax pictus]
MTEWLPLAVLEEMREAMAAVMAELLQSSVMDLALMTMRPW